MQAHKKHLLFFDGASHDNPGPMGASGILIDSNGNKLATFAWGLGTMTNNIVEAYALYARLRLVKECNISQISIFGDPMLIVKAVLKKQTVENNLLNGILQRIGTITEALENLIFSISSEISTPLSIFGLRWDQE
jgi:ribonuclease HI